MNRLIDMMTDVELSSKVLELFSGSPCLEKGWKRTSDLKQGLEALFKPAPNWSDNLEVSDSSTWVLCWVSDKSASSTSQAKWIHKVNSDGSYGALYHKYATPVDLNLRYKRGDD
tara:strand:+ start:1004 stop:1345 length:342 start_codon:yes stop_codon:yes gene_type:complete